MKKYQYSVNYRGTIEVIADDAQEAQDKASEQLPDDAVIVDWDFCKASRPEAHCDNETSGGDVE